VAEWRRLFAIEEIKGDGDKPGYSEPLTVEFLKANPYLVLDTAFFGRKFKEQLLASIDNLDEQIDGLLVCSENFQALNLLQERYREQVKCVYIDPPYNTEKDRTEGKFLYKDSYEHSSWLSMMYDRLRISSGLLVNTGSILVSIDDEESYPLKLVLDLIYKRREKNFIANLIWRKRRGGGNDSKFVATDHEYVLLYTKNSCFVKQKWRVPYEEEYLKRYKEEDNLGRFYWDTLSRPGLNNPIIYEVKCPDNTIITGEWQLSEKEFLLKLDAGDVRFSKNKSGEWTIHHKVRLPEGRVFRSIIECATNGDAANEMLALFGNKKEFSNPKPELLLKNLILLNNDQQGLIMDFFAGSGTTAHAVINLNREDGSKRKYILVEMGEYFDTVLKPRIQKVIYSKDWKDGKPVSSEGSSHMFKYIRLESYEDTLNNLELKRTPEQDGLFKDYPALREEYLLSYMLDIETSGSASLLNLDHFTNPFNYRLKIARHQEVREETVDLVETFNYLIGLRVQHIEPREAFTAMPDRRAAKPGAVKLRKAKGDQQDFIFQHVVGTNAAGEKVLVIWRTLSGDPVVDNAALDAYFDTKEFSARDNEFDCIYVNGDNNLANLSHEENGWKVLLIEEEFKRLMFDVQDV